MDNDLIEKSIETGELQLPFWQKVTHFEIVLWSFGVAVIMPLITLFYEIYDPARNKNSYGIIWYSLIFVSVGVMFYFIQKKRLKLTLIKANISRRDFDRILEKIRSRYGWRVSTNASKVIVAKTPFSGKSWGEQVTIIFDGNNLYINSICDPDKQTSVVSFGRNAQNIRLIAKRINNYSKINT